jgi:hypothetical protein
MGITAAPQDREPLRVPTCAAGWLAVALAVVSLVTFALPSLLGWGTAWLGVALAEALLAFSILMALR